MRANKRSCLEDMQFDRRVLFLRLNPRKCDNKSKSTVADRRAKKSAKPK
jgi:hypothetical protein